MLENRSQDLDIGEVEPESIIFLHFQVQFEIILIETMSIEKLEKALSFKTTRKQQRKAVIK